MAVPSLETVISREVLWKCKVTLKIQGKNLNTLNAGVTKPATQFLVNYGVTDALSPFPLHSLVSTMTATINNNTVSMNTSEVLPALLRLCDPEDLAYYNDMTPTTLDYLGNYADGVERMPYQLTISNNNPVADDGIGGHRPIAMVPYHSIAFHNAKGSIG